MAFTGYIRWASSLGRRQSRWARIAREPVRESLLTLACEDDAELGAQLAVVDAIAEKALADRFGVRGYPAIKWFSRGKVRDYKGARTARAIANYVIRHGGPVVRDVANATVLEAFKLSHRVVAVASLRFISLFLMVLFHLQVLVVFRGGPLLCWRVQLVPL